MAEQGRLDTVDELPRATRRCWDCGVGSGPCQCTPEFALFEAAEEERAEMEAEWLAYVERLIEEKPDDAP